MDATTELQLSCQPADRKGKVIVTARQGDCSLTDKLDITKAKAREDFAAKVVARWPGFKREDVERQLERLASDAVNPPAPEQPAPATAQTVEELLNQTPPDVLADAEAMLADPDLILRIIADIRELGIAGEETISASIYLIGTSRLLAKPLAGIVQGPSASGKSYIISSVAKLFPPEAVILATQMTPQALFHMEPGTLRNRFIVAGERSRMENDDTAEATRALREMLSEGRLNKLMPTKNYRGEVVTHRIEQEGPIAYVESTTLSRIFDEDANRCLLLQTDERQEQTELIVHAIGQRVSGRQREVDEARIIARHHALQRLLCPRDVVIPFAERLSELFPTGRLEARRAFGQVISMIRACVLLHQRQRSHDDLGRLVATAEDFRLTREILAAPIGRAIGGRMSDAAARFLDRLQPWATENFTTRQAAERESVSDRAVRGWLSELDTAGFLENVEPGRGPKPAVWRLTDKAQEGGSAASSGLPTVEEVCGATDALAVTTTPNVELPAPQNVQLETVADVRPEVEALAGISG